MPCRASHLAHTSIASLRCDRHRVYTVDQRSPGYAHAVFGSRSAGPIARRATNEGSLPQAGSLWSTPAARCNLESCGTGPGKQEPAIDSDIHPSTASGSAQHRQPVAVMPCESCAACNQRNRVQVTRQEEFQLHVRKVYMTNVHWTGSSRFRVVTKGSERHMWWAGFKTGLVKRSIKSFRRCMRVCCSSNVLHEISQCTSAINFEASFEALSESSLGPPPLIELW